MYGTKGAAAAAKTLQSCLTLCDPIDSSPPGSSVPEILQARTLEWVANSYTHIHFENCHNMLQKISVAYNPWDVFPTLWAWGPAMVLLTWARLGGLSNSAQALWSVSLSPKLWVKLRSTLLLLLLSRFSCVRLCATPLTAAHQAPPSLGFSRQEHWSGSPFPSPMHESEKWKWSRVWLFTTPWTAAHQAPPSMGFSRQEYWSGVPLPSPRSILPMFNMRSSWWI